MFSFVCVCVCVCVCVFVCVCMVFVYVLCDGEEELVCSNLDWSVDPGTAGADVRRGRGGGVGGGVKL